VSSADPSSPAVVRRWLRIGGGDRGVLIFVGVIAFVGVLNRTGAPGWLQTVALVAGGIVWQRYRWRSGGRQRMADGINEVAASLQQHRSGDSGVASIEAKPQPQPASRWTRVGPGERVILYLAGVFAVYVALSLNDAPGWLQIAAVVVAGLIWPCYRWIPGRR
jgi:hypothetical protein